MVAAFTAGIEKYKNGSVFLSKARSWRDMPSMQTLFSEALLGKVGTCTLTKDFMIDW
jgi:hypothetical protein